jgi:hypothetical protein
MKKIAVAALIAASLAAPALPVQAASTLAEWADENQNCLWFGVFKKECWEQAEGEVAARREAAVSAYQDASSDAADAAAEAADARAAWWDCAKAAKTFEEWKACGA